MYICRIRRRPAGFARPRVARRSLLRSARALAAPALLALSGALALPATAQAQTVVTLHLSPNQAFFFEDTAPSATVTATVAPASPVPFTVTISATPVAPATEDDFTLSTNRVLSFAANATASTGTVTIRPVPDEDPEPHDVVTVSGAVSNAAIPDPDNVTFTITNDDLEPFDVAVDAPAVVDEDAGTATVTVTLMTRQNSAPVIDVALFYFWRQETATRGDDYTLPSGPVFVSSVLVTTLRPSAFSPNAAGTAWVAQHAFTIGIVNDREVEVDETIVFFVTTGEYDSPHHTITIRDDDPIRVTSVVVASAPQSGDTYRSYETIVFTVTFSEPVKFEPHGRLRLEVGLDNPGGASGSTVEAGFWGQSKSERPTADTPRVSVSRHLHFEYKVQLFDRDADGVSIGANALRLASGARIQNEAGKDAELDHVAVGPLSDHKVDGSADVPMIERIEVVSTPRLRSQGTTSRDTYGEGENIRIEVRFDQRVHVEGDPTFALEVGDPFGSVCEAYYESGSGTDALVFAYLVLEVDVDRNGIAIPANPIEVVSGESISNAADQEAHLSYRRKGTQRGHKVDGSRAAGSHLSVEDAEAHEADGKMEFTVRLEPHGLGIVRVDYATRDGSARAGSDYTETSGTLRFNSLETERTVSVPISDDAHEDDGETFTLRLSNPDGAKIRGDDGEATGTIRNSEALTASFEVMPEAHDGDSAFRFRVAFSEPIGISYRSLREDAFTVTGGRVTRGKRVDDRRDLFEMTVEPDGAGEVAISLPAGRECGVSGAICTKGENRRQLTNAPTATVAGPAAAPLTASFVDVPAEHDGDSAFTLRMAFSEDIGISYRSLREDAFTVSGGRVTRGRRVNDRRDLFEMTVQPESSGDVTMTLPAGRPCAVSGAICTKGKNRRRLTNTPTATVLGPATPRHLTGSADDDTLSGRAGDDVLLGDAGDDTLDGDGGDDTLYGGDDEDDLYGGAGHDVLYGDDADSGAASGDDLLDGGSGDDTLYGDGGDDVLEGGADDDTLYGGSGNDDLYGDGGDDVLEGGSGDDSLTGGAGADTFVFAAGDGTDTITDFTPEEGDRIDLSAFAGLGGFASLTLTEDGSDTVLDLRAHGGGTVRLQGIAAADLLAADFLWP